MIYTVAVEKDGLRIFSHDIDVGATQSFSDDVRNALERFHENFPGVSLLDDDVSFSIARKPVEPQG